MDYCFFLSIMDTSVERVKFQLSHFQMYIWLEETASSLLGADNADELEWRLLVVACIYFLTFGLVTIVLPAPYGKFSEEELINM